LTDYLIKSK